MIKRAKKKLPSGLSGVDDFGPTVFKVVEDDDSDVSKFPKTNTQKLKQFYHTSCVYSAKK